MKNLTVLEKILLTVVGVVFSGWMGWLSVEVVGLSNKEREDTAQWKQLRRLDDRINSYHVAP